MKMKTLLVTGGCGFIGSHTCLSLLERNFNIIVIDSNINSKKISLERIIDIGLLENKEYAKKLTFIKGDIRDFSLLNNIFSNALLNKKPIEGVIHFAGLKAVEESLKDPLLYWDNNLCGSINLFKVMQKYGCQNIVFSSSATLYGNSLKKLIPENEVLKPCNTYGNTKLGIENLNKLYSTGKIQPEEIKILKFYHIINKMKFNFLLNLFSSFLMDSCLKQLNQNNPKIFWLDFYKLFYLNKIRKGV